jgi:signal transduction histidine kinase
MKLSGSGIEVAIEDNGRGFPVNPSPAGNGLQNLRERISALGGSLHFSNLPEGGASVAFSIPLSAHA